MNVLSSLLKGLGIAFGFILGAAGVGSASTVESPVVAQSVSGIASSVGKAQLSTATSDGTGLRTWFSTPKCEYLDGWKSGWAYVNSVTTNDTVYTVVVSIYGGDGQWVATVTLKPGQVYRKQLWTKMPTGYDASYVKTSNGGSQRLNVYTFNNPCD
jgi:hypothetical protein